MERKFQIATLWQKLDYARSINPTNVCNGITDVKSILAVLDVDNSDLVDLLDTAFEVADIALGFGEAKLEGTYAGVRTRKSTAPALISQHISGLRCAGHS